MLSGRLTEQAPRRLSEMSRFVQAGQPAAGMHAGADGLKITSRSALHAHVRRLLLRSGRWDSASWGAPINQHDMAADDDALLAGRLEGLRRLGFVIEHGEAERYMHLWRYVASSSGVDPGAAPGVAAQATAGSPS